MGESHNNTFRNIIIRQIKKHGAVFSGMQFSIVVNSLAIGVAYTEIIRQTTDAIWEKNYQKLWETFSLLVILILVFFLINIGKRKWTFQFQKNLTYAMEDGIYDHYSELGYWTKEGGDKTLGHIKKVVPEAVELLINQINMVWGIIIVIISGCLYGISINPAVLLSSVLVTSVLAVFSRESRGRISDLYQEFTENNSAMYHLLWEQVRNREIAGFLDQDRVLEGYDKKSREYLMSLLRIKKVTNGAGLFSQFGSMIAIVQVSLIGGWMVFKGRLSFSDLLALILLIQTIASYIFRLPEMVQGFRKIAGYKKDIDQLLSQKQVSDGKTGKNLQKLKEKIYEIRMEGVSFVYPSAEKAAVQGINISLSAGNFYVIAGKSGCGKTTLLRLMARLTSEWKGNIWINSSRLDGLARDSYWKHLALVEQTPTIIPGRTLLYNITFNEEQYDSKRLKQVIKETLLEGYLDQQSKGLMTILTEKQLSKGEMKKVNIARALYCNADVLLLDEMTEGLDCESEKSILQALRRCVKVGMMVVSISHKPETLRMADKVIFMRESRILGVASHEEWLKRDEAYQNLMEVSKI